MQCAPSSSYYNVIICAVSLTHTLWHQWWWWWWWPYTHTHTYTFNTCDDLNDDRSYIYGAHAIAKNSLYNLSILRNVIFLMLRPPPVCKAIIHVICQIIGLDNWFQITIERTFRNICVPQISFCICGGRVFFVCW